MKNNVIEGKRTDKGCTLTIDGHPLAHVVKHSPTGMEWGYGGSGPADTALSILNWALDGKDVPVYLYQKFKWDFVAKWHGNDIKEFIDIDAWLKKQEAKGR